jgi:transketolase
LVNGQETETRMTESQPLSWVPRSEFSRVLASIPDRYDRVQAFATLCRINSLYMITQAGSGHIGSSFSAIDIVSWLLLAELDNPNIPGGDVYFSSKGHDVPSLYAAYIGLGYLDEGLVHRLRRAGGLPGHPDVGTPGIPFNTGSLGMGISKAKGLVLADRLAGRHRRVFVLTGDGELQEGQIWESLPGAAKHAMAELTVLVDHNKIQSDTWVHDVSDLGDLEARFRSCGWRALRCDGHDLRALEEALRQRTARYPGQPTVIVADTVKGAGVERFASTSLAPGEWRYRFHSGAPQPGDYQAARAELTARADDLLARYGAAALATQSAAGAVPASGNGQPAWRLPEVYGRALADSARLDNRVVALDADLVLDTGLLPFRDAFPERFVECGIAEQDMEDYRKLAKIGFRGSQSNCY